MVARHAAAEAVVAALAVLAVEARALLAVERAAGPIVAARHIGLLAIPRHAPTDHGRNRHAVAYLVEKVVGKAHVRSLGGYPHIGGCPGKRQEFCGLHPLFTALTEMTAVYTVQKSRRDRNAPEFNRHQRIANAIGIGPRLRDLREWDENKRRANLLKHDIDFIRAAAAAALQRPHMTITSNREGEARTLAICPDTHKLIAVIDTMVGQACRIISARAARKNEQRAYRQIFG